jgi:hypothetical protein
MAGAGGTASMAGAGGSAGAGGAPVPNNRCTGPYTPAGGPRPDGPELIIDNCANIGDDVILARYDDFEARIPQGLYHDPNQASGVYQEPCSDALEDTLARAAQVAQASDIGMEEGGVTMPWFYGATYCRDSGVRWLYRNLRCDYYDGTTFAGSSQDVPFLASVLWATEYENLSGAHILGYSISIGDFTDQIEMCTIQTVGGDFGLCDEITLYSTVHRLQADGVLVLGEPMPIRTIEGECN